jgi:Skp family chaperone for outer membrane proteins
MKRLFTALTAYAILSFTGSAFPAEGIKFASVDVGMIAQESKAGAEAKKDLEKLKETLGKTLKKKEAELDKIRSALEGQGKQLTDKERSAKAKEFQKKIEAYRETAQKAQKELLDKGDEYSNKIMGAVELLVKEYALKNNYALVIKKGDLLFNDEKNQVTDITADILKLYDNTPQDAASKK